MERRTIRRGVVNRRHSFYVIAAGLFITTVGTLPVRGRLAMRAYGRASSDAITSSRCVGGAERLVSVTTGAFGTWG
jgi:hypothetical protein